MIRLIRGYVRGLHGDAVLLNIILAKGVSMSEWRQLRAMSPYMLLPGDWPA